MASSPVNVDIPIKEEFIPLAPEQSNVQIPDKQEIKSPDKKTVTDIVAREWNGIINEMQQNQPRLAGILSIATYTVGDDAITVQFQSQAQESLFINEIRKDFSTRLCKALGAAKVTITTRVEEQKEKSAKPYFPQEKYNYLLGKNPALDKLKEKFNLNIKQ